MDGETPARRATAPPKRPAEITPEEVRRLCRLARLEIDAAEVSRLRAELGRILAYVRLLEEVDTAGPEPPLPAPQGPGALRADAVRAGAGQQLALRDAPESRDGFFAVPPVIARRRRKHG